MFELQMYTKQTKDIWFWENIFKDPKKIVDYILKDDSKWKNNYRQNGELLGKGIVITNENEPELWQEFSNALSICFLQYIDYHNLSRKNFKFDSAAIEIKKMTGFCSGMPAHTDSYIVEDPSKKDTELEFTMICYLNGDFEGGEINLPEHSISIKPKPGSLLMFPKKYEHSVSDLISGDRFVSVIFGLKTI